jgi:TolB-like protein
MRGKDLTVSNQDRHPRNSEPVGLWAKIRSRGVARVAVSYAIIAWLVLQIGDVILEPLDAPGWVMRALIVLIVSGFPISLVLAWFLELGPTGIGIDKLPDAASRPKVQGIRRYADAIVIALLLGVIVLLLARQGGVLDEEDVTPVIGVLPFTDVGDTSRQEDHSNGLADMLTYKLGHLQQLIVLAPSSTLQFRGQDQDIAMVGAKLGATSLLQGTVRRIGNRLQVNARLVEVASGIQVWSGSFDRQANDLFAVQDEIATAVTEALNLVLSPEQEQRLLRHQTEMLSAYDSWVLANHKLALRQHDQLSEAVQMLRKAVQLDPKFALAHAALAEALALAMIHIDWEYSWESVGTEARRAVATAHALDPDLSDAYYSESLLVHLENDLGDSPPWPKEQAVTLLRRALQLNPNNAKAAYRLAGTATSQAEQIELYRQVTRLDPRSSLAFHAIASIYSEQDEYDTAVEWYLKSAASADPYFSLGYAGISRMYLGRAARPDEAARWALAFRSTHPDDFRSHLELVHALIQLAAWNETEAALASLKASGAQIGTAGSLNLYLEMQLARARGNIATAAEIARKFSQDYLEKAVFWPDLTHAHDYHTIMVSLALEDLAEGRPQAALDRYQHHYPDWSLFSVHENSKSEIFRPDVMVAALQKQIGQSEEAGLRLRAYLAKIQDDPWLGEAEGVGFTRFTVHAFLGETDLAIEALESALEAGWILDWSELPQGNFDTDYASVTADPRFQSIYRELEARITAMRESWLAQPEIPEGYVLQ